MKTTLILLLISLSFQGLSQEIKKENIHSRNGFLVELGGHGLFYSLNYERILVIKSAFRISSQAGISYYPAKTGVRDIWIPVVINEIWPFGKHHLEVGLGYIFVHEAVRDLENNPEYWFWSGIFTGRIGYRYQVPGKRFIFRAGFTPFLEAGNYSTEFHPSGGLSFGYGF